ncbi:MAG: 8-amino-7-oxononanoate synthase [Rikenellaceae bacterium]
MIRQKLDELADSGNYRSLRSSQIVSSKIISIDNNTYLNLSTNDYLALSDANVQKQFVKDLDFSAEFMLSNPSSRLMCGNSEDYTILEDKLAKLFNKEAALVLSSGFMVNSGVLQAVTTKKKLVIADKKVHASIIEGMKLCEAQSMRFKHNSIEHLQSLLEKYSAIASETWVVVESIYSMDGDIAPLAEICELKKKYGFKLYVDEAHAFGVRGAKGCGMLEELGLSAEAEIIVATLGKSAASCGGFLICSALYKELLINKMRTLIFSTALAPINLKWSSFIVDIIEKSTERRAQIDKLRKVACSVLNKQFESHIIPIKTGCNFKTLELVEQLKAEGYLATAIRYPTVAKGDEMVRVSLNASMTEEELVDFFNAVLEFA